MGFTITSDARCGTEIEERIALSKDPFTKMKSIFNYRNIKVYTKINSLKAYMVHPSVWILMLDTDKSPRKKT